MFHRIIALVLMEFFLNVSLNLLNSLNSVTKIFVITVKGLEPATQPPLELETSGFKVP